MQPQTRSRRTLLSGSLAAVVGSLAPLRPAAAAGGADDWGEPVDSAGIDRAALRKVLQDAASVPALRSILVVKNGALAGEQYFGGMTAADLQAVNSVTKSVASMLVGMALEQGRIKSLSETVATLLPSAAQVAPGAASLSITLEQILTDTSGLVYDDRTGMSALEAAQDPLAFVLGLPVDPQKVGKWVYNDAAISLLSPILARAHGMPVDQIAQRDLFRPLGIEKVAGARDKAGNFMSYRGLRLRARDLAKIAWTMADDGRWGNRQLVPSQWVKDSTITRVPTRWSAAPMLKTGYGLLWFTGTLADHPVFWAWGYGAQFALVVPARRLVVTTTAANPSPRDLDAQNNAVMTVVSQIVALAG